MDIEWGTSNTPPWQHPDEGAPPQSPTWRPTAPGEILKIDPKTGGQKGTKKAQFHLIPREFLWELAEHYGGNTPEFGGKYPARNWERGYDWSLSFDSVQRHLYSWVSGERYDKDTGKHHLICAAWHIVALFIFDTRKLGTDNLTALTDTPR